MRPDAYRELTGAPEESPEHEAAVEQMVERMAPVFREQAIDCLSDLLDSFAPAYVRPIQRTAEDDEADAVFADALEQFRMQLIATLPGGEL